MILIYWPGGSFGIGKACGNLQGFAGQIPPPNSAPTGTLTLSCDISTGQQTAVASFSDPDGATTATLTTGSPPNNLNAALASSPKTVLIPISDTSPYVPQPVNLIINDSGPTHVPGATVTITKNTVPCVPLTCGSPVTAPTVVDPYMSFSLTVSVTNPVNVPPVGSFSITVTPPLPATGTVFSGTQVAGGSSSVSTATFAVPAVHSVNASYGAGVYAVQWTFAGKACSGNFSVVYLPYLNVYGGDVSVGNSPSFAGGASACASDGAAGAYSWNNHSAGFTGAGAQYAVTALAGIVDFASALSSDSPAPAGLSFANIFNPADATKFNPPAGLFGGYFNGVGSDCDFTSDITATPITVATTIAATTVPVSTATVQYISGADVYISGNIVYASTGGWTSISQIPSYRLVVVGGDIYVSSNVTQLDGLYVAEPNGAVGGRIFTCASAPHTPVNPQALGSYTTCNKQLAINGAFVAKYVSFGRTFGTLGQATATDSLTSNHDAEVFNYTPELWVPRGTSPPNSGYTAITGLPPVL